ncbi:MAG: hypothetical protein ACPG4X_15930 [Pikeienuella sp.]
MAKHRAMVAVELEVLAKKFDRFGWDRDRGSLAHDRTLTDWMDALQDYPLSEIQDACKAAVLNNPNKMPNEGHVRAEIMKARALMVSRTPRIEHVEEKAPPVTPEQATEIMEKAGFTPRRFGDSK